MGTKHEAATKRREIREAVQDGLTAFDEACRKIEGELGHPLSPHDRAIVHFVRVRDALAAAGYRITKAPGVSGEE